MKYLGFSLLLQSFGSSSTRNHHSQTLLIAQSSSSDFYIEEVSTRCREKLSIDSIGRLNITRKWVDDSQFIPTNPLKILTSVLKNSFLPTGFPQSVPEEYPTFQFYNICQDACSLLRGIMSTTAILEGMGVGRSDVTALQATVQWIMRDGAGMLGSLLFTTFSSANFGTNVKFWRFFADMINNVGITLELVAPIFRPLFLPLVCTASICKALCGVAAGASGAAISEHWGFKNGNIADVLAKNGAQHTLLSLAGLVSSVSFARFANKSPQRVWTVYGLLTLLHMYCNYMALKLLALRSINESRLKLLLRNFLDIDITKILLAKAHREFRMNEAGWRLKSQKGSLREESFVQSVIREQSLGICLSLSPKCIAKDEPILYPLIEFRRQLASSFLRKLTQFGKPLGKITFHIYFLCPQFSCRHMKIFLCPQFSFYIFSLFFVFLSADTNF